MNDPRPGGPAADPLQRHPGPPQSVRALLDAAAIRLEQRGRRADLVLDAPDRLNAQTPATWRAVAAAAEWLDGRATVVVVCGEGRSFSAGLDKRAFTPEGIPGELALLTLAAQDDATIDATVAQFQHGFLTLAQASFVSIAAVQGHAIGAGFQLALACDLRVATQEATFSMKEAVLGIVPDLAGTKPLVEAVGYPRALEWCATGRPVGAPEAHAAGLVSAVAPADRLAETVDGLVDGLLAANGGAVAATKALLRGASGRTLPEQAAAERVAQTARLQALAATFAR